MSASQENASPRAAVSPQQQAVIDSYFDVCNTISRVLQTHLGAQQTLNYHRQAVIALQESLVAVCRSYCPRTLWLMLYLASGSF
jgi:hypothetical protein